MSPTWNLARFDGFGGSQWTVRVSIDSRNNLSHFQYSFFRPKAGQTVLPSTAGANWQGTATASRLQQLLMSSNAGLANTTWLAVERWDPPPNQSVMIFGYRRSDLGNACISGGKTVICHSPGGLISNEGGLVGTCTSAFGNEDGVGHSWTRRATYWIKDASADGTP